MADAKSELYELGRLGATPVRNSGRGFWKGDGLLLFNDDDADSKFFTVDVKEYRASFGLSKTVWTKIQTDAKFNKTNPMLKVVIGDEKDEKSRVRMVVISEEVFLDMWESYKENQ